jgi:hypothetical protein
MCSVKAQGGRYLYVLGREIFEKHETFIKATLRM